MTLGFLGRKILHDYNKIKAYINTKKANSSCEVFVKEGEYNSTKYFYLLGSCLSVLKLWPSKHISLALALLLEVMKTYVSRKLSSAL